MTNAPNRRGFRFSLRTLFVVVTCACVWLAWNIRDVREHNRIALKLRDANATHRTTLVPAWGEDGNYESYKVEACGRLPLLWRLLGALPVYSIEVSDDEYTDAEYRHFVRLFPEANVILFSDRMPEARDSGFGFSFSSGAMELLLLAIPFCLIGKWSLALARARNSPWHGFALFAACATVLGLIYAQGYASTRELMADQMWAAASMAIAVMLVKSVPVLLACWLAHWYLWPNDQPQ